MLDDGTMTVVDDLVVGMREYITQQNKRQRLSRT